VQGMKDPKHKGESR